MTTSPQILNVHHAQLSVPTGDEKKARDFYCGVLGLKEVSKPETLAGRGGFWLELGQFQVHIGTEEFSGRAGTKAHIAYEVTALDGWKDKLAQAGITVTTGIQIPHYSRFEFRDPFGNRVEFLERI
ncbi:MAG TPA: VOC family protein [Pyrinomonadaceae bacterium]|nr:VOC family protein [Pyrinomonadaceae bacterium]